MSVCGLKRAGRRSITELSEARVAVTHQPGDLLRAGNKFDPGGNRDNKVKVNYNVSVLIKRHMGYPMSVHKCL